VCDGKRTIQITCLCKKSIERNNKGNAEKLPCKVSRGIHVCVWVITPARIEDGLLLKRNLWFHLFIGETESVVIFYALMPSVSRNIFSYKWISAKDKYHPSCVYQQQ
jgi:hypothetical protein